MLFRMKDAGDPLVVANSSVMAASIPNDIVVRKFCDVHICGNVRGSLTVEQGANVVVDGFVDGKILNKGGKLAVNNGEGIGEFAALDGPPEAEAGGILRVNLAAIALNWRALAKRTAAECAAVVSANAHGCGIGVVAAALAKSGCNTFFVSDLLEAKRVRKVAPKSAIYVLNGLYPGTGPIFAEIGAQPVIGSHIEMAEWDVFVASSHGTGGFALHVYTGADGFGVSSEEAAALAPRIHSRSHRLTLLMSDLDNREKPDPAAHDRQIKLFQELRLLYPGVPASLAGSSGILSCPKAHFDVVRSGAMLYGVNPTPGASNPMLPVIELRARIVQVRNLARGEKIAGNGGWTAKRQTRLAMVSVGYADGYPRSGNGVGSKLQAIVAGRQCPVAGHASMDLLAIDITDLPDPRLARRGEMVTLIGEGITIDDLAAAAQSTASELLINLGARFHRIYYVA